MWGHASHLILMDWIMKKCIVIVGWHYLACESGMYTLEKRQEIREHSYNIVIGFYILKTKKKQAKSRGETKPGKKGVQTNGMKE